MLAGPFATATKKRGRRVGAVRAGRPLCNHERTRAESRTSHGGGPRGQSAVNSSACAQLARNYAFHTSTFTPGTTVMYYADNEGAGGGAGGGGPPRRERKSCAHASRMTHAWVAVHAHNTTGFCASSTRHTRDRRQRTNLATRDACRVRRESVAPFRRTWRSAAGCQTPPRRRL